MTNLWGQKAPKFKEKQVNLLKGKWGFEDARACAVLNFTRREMLLKAQSGWSHLTQPQRDYFKDAFDFEVAWENRSCRDWRTFWKQPQGTKDDVINLDGWWHDKGGGIHPTGGESKDSPTPPIDQKAKLKQLMKETGLL